VVPRSHRPARQASHALRGTLGPRRAFGGCFGAGPCAALRPGRKARRTGNEHLAPLAATQIAEHLTRACLVVMRLPPIMPPQGALRLLAAGARNGFGSTIPQPCTAWRLAPRHADRNPAMPIHSVSPGRLTCQYTQPSRLVLLPSRVRATPPAAAEGLLYRPPSTTHAPFSMAPW
jgi:hypothetical protein